MASAISRVLPDMSKLEPLDGSNYKRWSQKLLIFFEQLEVSYVLLSEMPNGDSDSAGASTGQSDEAADAATLISSTKVADDDAKKKFQKDNNTVRWHMLNHMSNTLFDLFVNIKFAKQIWDALETKYGGDDAGKKKYVVGKWLQFHMVDNKSILEQLHEYENLTADVLNEGMKMCEILQANILLEKFPPSWNDYRNQLKHKKRDLSLHELISHIRTEEANRLKDKCSSFPNFNANLVETAGFSGKGKTPVAAKKGSFHANKNYPNRFNKGDDNRNSPNYFNKGSDKKIMKNGGCYVCGDPGHKAFQCLKRHGQPQKPYNKPAANAGNHAHIAETEDIIAAVVEANLVENKTDWILDTGASRHFCTKKELFHDFEDAGEGECVYMGNSSIAGVLGKGKILLKLTSGKTLSLNNALFVPSMRRNLISGALLNKAGLKIVVESDRVVLTKNGEFVGKGYLNEGLFVLNVASELVNGNCSTSAYIVENASTSSIDERDLHTPSIVEHEQVVETRRSKRQRTETNFGDDFITAFLIDNPDKIADPNLLEVDRVFWFIVIKSFFFLWKHDGCWQRAKKDLIREIFRLVWEKRGAEREKNQLSENEAEAGPSMTKRSRLTTANANALKLSCELLRVFVAEAIQRAAAIAEAEGSLKIEATHLERILPQLLLDF
ncbi:centromere protein X [Perilla frutescens var. hirtella]|nr:centromere protein X [Perilla frutescens var. hirtella]